MGKPGISKSNRIDTTVLKVPQYCCEVKGCRKYFHKLSRLKYHQNTHLAEKPFKCDYDGCTSSYYRPNHLKRHVESIHESSAKISKEHKCDHEGCEAAFDSEASLYYHKKRKHSVQQFECSFCDKKFQKKWMLKEHEAGHTGGNPFKCDEEACGKEFRDFRLFRAHKRVHEKAKREKQVYNCSVEQCQLSFTKWSELVNHKKSCHPTELKCSVCEKTFSSKQYLKVHVQVHEEERTSYQCPIKDCPRFYLHIKNLNHHLRIKHEDLGFQCPKCKRKLSSKQKLDHHIKTIHEGNGYYKNRKKVQKSAEEVLNKIAPITEVDMEIKKTGPSRYIRGTNGLKFPDSNGVKENNDEESYKEIPELAEDVTEMGSTAGENIADD
ncbi:Transcription factor IIIA [Orchesella cincta]|uniref:Transcription factor IIIA n=1 Tax=Orchesella cincta TaxID=48709 RepID=A0A1D2NJS1_ORCCI|nr:Transcription factor IIIA [Orchesella cincta]